MPEPEPLLAAGAALVLLGVFASKISARLGVPALLMFLAIGMFAGSDGLGGIEFDDYQAAQSVGIVALAFILFSGGLDTDWLDVRPVLREGTLLATVGVAITAVSAGAFAAWVFGFDLTTGLLLGAIISSTDAAAVFSVLGTGHVGLRGHVRPLLEFESGINDPMSVFLTIGFLTLLDDRSASLVDLIPLFAREMAVGAVVGYVIARVMVELLNRLELEYEGLYPVVTIATVLLIYGCTSLLEGSGFLAVYVAGLVMGNTRFLHKKSLTRFHDAVAWLAQITMFLLLGLLVFPSDLVDVALPALLVCGVLIFVARPVAAFVCLLGGRLQTREKLMVSWVGLRGAVPIILATFPLVEGIDDAEKIFNVVFFIVLSSVLIQGTTIPYAARRLRVSAPVTPRPTAPLEFVETGGNDVELHQFVIQDNSSVVGRRLVELGLADGTLVVLISREGQYLIPQGATVLEPGDTVLVLAGAEALPDVRALFEGG